ncbi:hypothetical protein A0H81_12802 [Grifola frondosa]|uniref:Uncharacterized protein n=1 Tax=Grifola frondosa TaxID=5627 RepID=A0A1C7LSY3_GRIFR|nr:hypothetical protein A0H81_12802 [Grifola frondosa]
MGQYWRVINLDKKEFLPDTGKLSTLLFQPYPTWLVYYLAVPIASSCPESIEATSTTTAALGILRLPTELILVVFDNIDDPQDAVCLGLAHDALLPIGWDRIKGLIMAASPAGSWAGDRVVCIGDEARSDYLPMLTLSEMQELNTKEENNFYNYVYDEFTEARLPVKWKPYTVIPRLSSHEQMMLRRILEDPQDSQWVLCNLTTRQYVTSNALEDLCGVPGKPGPQIFTSLGFGHVLLSRICWSSDPETDVRHWRDLGFGDWAGDRFEITTMQEMRSYKGRKPGRMSATQSWKR